jgi:hypothetical protein
MKKVSLILSSVVMTAMMLSSCAGGPTSKSYDNLNTECEYVEAIMDIHKYLKEEFASEFDGIGDRMAEFEKGDGGLDNGNFDIWSENRKQELCHGIIIIKCLREELIGRVRGRYKEMSPLNGRDLQNCPNFNKMNMEELIDLDDLYFIYSESLHPYNSSFPRHLKERFNASSHLWEKYEEVEQQVQEESAVEQTD